MVFNRLCAPGSKLGCLRLRAARDNTRGRRTMLPIYRGEGGLAGEIDPARNESLYDAADS